MSWATTVERSGSWPTSSSRPSADNPTAQLERRRGVEARGQRLAGLCQLPGLAVEALEGELGGLQGALLGAVEDRLEADAERSQRGSGRARLFFAAGRQPPCGILAAAVRLRLRVTK